MILGKEKSTCKLLQQNLADCGHQVENCLDLSEVTEPAPSRETDLIVFFVDDFNQEALEMIKSLKPDGSVKPILFLVLPEGYSLSKDMQAYVDDSVVQPMAMADLIGRVKIQLKLHALKKKLYLSEKKFRQFIENSLDSILILSGDGQLLFHNNRFSQMLKGKIPEPIFGRIIDTLFPISDLFKEISNVFMKVRETNKPVSIETQMTISNGRAIILELNAQPVLDESNGDSVYQIRIQNVTHRRRVEEALLQAEKINSLSILTAGIAHEINNPLTAVSSAIQMLKRGGIEKNRETELFTMILAHIDRIAKIVKDLRIFSQPGQGSTAEVFSIKETLSETLALSRLQVNESRIKFSLTHSENSLRLFGNKNLFQQVIINLLINAIHAVGDVGSINIQSSRKGPNALVTIEDNGRGIPSSELERIFDPFFTTKRDWKGTGLGLAVSYRIIQIFKGTITVSSIEGKGSRFTLTLPLYQPDTK